jgi:hypothetical protein
MSPGTEWNCKQTDKCGTTDQGAMTPTVQVGAILMREWPGMTQLLGLESEPCSGEWSLLKVLDGHTLDRKIHAAGWNFLFHGSRNQGDVFWPGWSRENPESGEADLREGQAATVQWG